MQYEEVLQTDGFHVTDQNIHNCYTQIWAGAAYGAELSFNGVHCKIQLWDRAADRLYVMVWNDPADPVQYQRDGTYSRLSKAEISGKNCAVMYAGKKLKDDLETMH